MKTLCTVYVLHCLLLALVSNTHDQFPFRNRRRSIPRMAAGCTDTTQRRELEKTRQLLLEAKQVCTLDVVSVKIQAALQEVDLFLQPTPMVSPVAARHSATFSMLSDLPDLTIMEDQDMISGDLWKRGSRLRQMIKRYYALQGNFLYYYAYVSNRPTSIPTDPSCAFSYS